MKSICVNLRVQEYEKISGICRTTSYNKRDIISEAVGWQLDHLEGECLTYAKSTRRSAVIRLNDDELTDLKNLAQFMDCTPAQAALIATRNFVAANEDGRCDYFRNADVAEIPENFLVTVPHDVYDAVNESGGKINGKIKEAINLCHGAKALPEISKRSEGTKRPAVRAYLPQDEIRGKLQDLMVRNRDSASRTVARCLAHVHLYGYRGDDLELF